MRIWAYCFTSHGSLDFQTTALIAINPPSIIIWFSPKDIPALVTLIEAKVCNFSCRFSKVSGFIDPLVSFSFLPNAKDFLLFFKADHFFLTTPQGRSFDWHLFGVICASLDAFADVTSNWSVWKEEVSMLGSSVFEWVDSRAVEAIPSEHNLSIFSESLSFPSGIVICEEKSWY